MRPPEGGPPTHGPKPRRAIVPRRFTVEEIRRIWPPLVRNTPTVRQASSSLLIGLFIFLGSGLVLAHSTATLLAVQGLITLLPASNALRGNIYGPLGSRLGTYLHTGLVRPRLGRSRVMEQNLLATTTQSLLMAFLLAGLSWGLLAATGIPVVGPHHLLFVALVSAVLSGVILSGAAFALSSLVFRQGLNPDNLNAPIITAGGDLLSVSLVIGLGHLLLATDFSLWLVLPVDAAGAIATVALLGRTLSLKRPIARQIFRQSLVILVVTVALELLVGLVLEHSLDTLVAVPALLLLIPPFIGESGNFASIHGSRLSSAAHLGMTRVGRTPDAVARGDLRDMATVAALLYPAIALTVLGFSPTLGAPAPDPWRFLGATLLAGAVDTAVVLPLGYYITFLAFRWGADPDNVVIPITNSVIDVLGAFFILFAAGLVGLL